MNGWQFLITLGTGIFMGIGFGVTFVFVWVGGN